MTEQDALDAAARAAGYDDWREVGVMNDRGGMIGQSIGAHANQILARQAVEKELADLRKEVSEVLIAWYHGRVVPGCFRRFIIPAPDPLAEVIKAMGDNYHEGEPLKMADEQRQAAERLGYAIKLERIDQ